jgi:translation initiation factor IF-2
VNLNGGVFCMGRGSRKTGHHHIKKKEKPAKVSSGIKDPMSAKTDAKKKLEIVLKCDTSGCAEAIISAIKSFALPEVEINIISSGVGAINKSDVFLAETGSRLIIGFNVGLMPHIDQIIFEHNVEIRLFEVIYKLLEDTELIARSLIPQEPSEEIIGSAKVIALFKSSRRGIILGCEVLNGRLMLGRSFRVLGAMGLIYTGRIESLHIEKDAVREAKQGQQVGLKIRDFNKAKLGDLVESFHSTSGPYGKPWQPQGKVYYP